jgi:hypothetical protein
VRPLYKTTIVVWTDYDPTSPDADIEMFDDSLEKLMKEAREGAAYCSKQESVKVEDPLADPAWDNTEFFDDPTEDEDDSAG